MLVNNAGVGIGAPVAEHATKRVDMQLDLNLRAIILFYRECADMLRAAGAEHRNALVVNTVVDRRQVRPGVAVGLLGHEGGGVGCTQAMNKELNGEGIKSRGAVPGFVDTPMTDFIKRAGPRRGDDPHRPTSPRRCASCCAPHPACVVPEIVFQRPGETSDAQALPVAGITASSVGRIRSPE